MAHAYVDPGQTLSSGRASAVMSRSAPGWPARDSGWGSACARFRHRTEVPPGLRPSDVLLRWLESVSLQFCFNFLFPLRPSSQSPYGVVSSARPGKIKTAHGLSNL